MSAALSIFATSLTGLALVLAGTQIKPDEWRNPILASGAVICAVAVIASVAFALGVFGYVEG